jgi:hypothetical protein
MRLSDLQIYRGNRNLKRSNVQVEFTADQILEFAKCANDPVYFCENYVKIVNVDKGLIPFKPFDFQKDMAYKVQNNRFVICKMPRQVGKTTGIVGLLLHFILFNENYNIAVLANKEKQAREILARVALAYEWLPPWLQQGIIEWNKSTVELENGSKITASSTSSDAIRGQSYNLIYLDEFAFVPRNIQDSFFASVFPTISSGKTTKLVITSTPNGMDLFYKLWVDSEQGRNDYVRCDVHWSAVPGRDEAWKEAQIRNTSADQFRQEFECEFLGSTNTLIHATILSKLTFKQPYSSDGKLDVYYPPEKDHFYVCTVDVSRGVGLDYSAFTVIDCTSFPYKIAAKFRDNMMQPVLFPWVIKQVCDGYNNAHVLVEVNDNGQQIVDMLYQEYEYENIIMTQMKGRAGTRVGGGYGAGSRIGIRTTSVTKKIGCSNLKTLIENHKLLIEDYDIIQELSTFIANKASFEAEEGHHDDLVMCLVLFAWLANQAYFRELGNLDFRQTIASENEQMIEEMLTPFGFIDDGRHEQFSDEIQVIESSNFERDLLL